MHDNEHKLKEIRFIYMNYSPHVSIIDDGIIQYNIIQYMYMSKKLYTVDGQAD